MAVMMPYQCIAFSLIWFALVFGFLALVSLGAKFYPGASILGARVDRTRYERYGRWGRAWLSVWWSLLIVLSVSVAFISIVLPVSIAEMHFSEKISFLFVLSTLSFLLIVVLPIFLWLTSNSDFELSVAQTVGVSLGWSGLSLFCLMVSNSLLA